MDNQGEARRSKRPNKGNPPAKFSPHPLIPNFGKGGSSNKLSTRRGNSSQTNGEEVLCDPSTVSDNLEIFTASSSPTMESQSASHGALNEIEAISQAASTSASVVTKHVEESHTASSTLPAVVPTIICPKCKLHITGDCIRIDHDDCTTHWLHEDCLNSCPSSAFNYCPVCATRGTGTIKAVAHVEWVVKEVKASEHVAITNAFAHGNQSQPGPRPTIPSGSGNGDTPSLDHANRKRKLTPTENLMGPERSSTSDTSPSFLPTGSGDTSTDDEDDTKPADDERPDEESVDESDSESVPKKKKGFSTKCEKCNYVYKSRQDKFKHLHKPPCGVPPPPSICSKCGLTFTLRYNLLAHERTVKCGKSIAQPSVGKK